jgi:hypothetical protein
MALHWHSGVIATINSLWQRGAHRPLRGGKLPRGSAEVSNIPPGITRDDVLAALADVDARIDHGFRDSTGYDVEDHDRRYPPKVVVALAARRLLGRPLVAREFKGGEGAECCRLLRSLGFTIVPKLLPPL